MSKRHVAIITDSGNYEQIIAALNLAHYSDTLYWYAQIYTLNRDNKCFGASHEFDSQSILFEPDNSTVINKIRQCDAAIFFEPCPHILDILHHRTRRSSTVYFFNPYNVRQETIHFAKACTHVYCTSSRFAEMAKMHGINNTAICPLAMITQQIIPKEGFSEKDTSMFIAAFGVSFLQCQSILLIRDVLKCAMPHSRTVVGTYDTHTLSSPGFDTRVNDYKLMQYAKNSDVILDLNPCPNFSMMSFLAAGLEIPWFGLDMPPHNDPLYSTCRNLIPARLSVDNIEIIAHNIMAQIRAFRERRCPVRSHIYARQNRINTFVELIGHLLK